MRLWHEALIPYLPRQQLLGQHRECCALRGLGWGRKHATVNYVFEHHPAHLVAYHILVMEEMDSRGYKTDVNWWDYGYRGKKCAHLNKDHFKEIRQETVKALFENKINHIPIYPEHDAAYLQECLDNLAAKGIHINMAGN